MNAKIKQKWLKALRSGEYKQGRKCLHSKDGSFCCLGVLTDIYAKEHKLKWEESEDTFTFLNEDGILPKKVMEWAELQDAKPLIEDGLNKSLTSLNDRGVSFKELADIIEKYL